jgi:hypothetical protein
MATRAPYTLIECRRFFEAPATDVRVPEANRLQGGNSFRDTARVLRMTRYMVGWASTAPRLSALAGSVVH